jgi:hypothetical protein
MSHTPGPWHWTHKSDGVNDWGHCGPDLIGPNKESIVRAWGHDEWGIEVLTENARLIAAAPELLAACQLLMTQYDAQPEFVMGGKLTNEPFLTIRAAITKATSQ